MIDKIINLVRNVVSWIVEKFTFIFIAVCLVLGYIIGAKEVEEWRQYNNVQSEDYFCSAWAERTNEKGQTRKEAGTVNLFITKKKDENGAIQQRLEVFTELTSSPSTTYGYLSTSVKVIATSGNDELKGVYFDSTIKREYSLAFEKESKVLTLQVDARTLDANGVILRRDLSNITAYCGLK